jgi:glycosidase
MFPVLYQINARVWLFELGQRLGRPATFDDVPDAFLADVAARGFDWVWWLGVWQTGPLSREIAREHVGLQAEYRRALPDFAQADVAGSPFAISDYVVHVDFGGAAALARLRERMKRHGLKLLLDFVPNHLSPDHRWVRERPEYFVHGTAEAFHHAPQNYREFETARGTRILAHGRDPYFDGWSDTVQLNYRHAGCRAAMTRELLRVAEQCDGVRCDMAMLLLPEVFQRTWGDLGLPSDGTPPVDTSYWPEAIAEIRSRQPGFLFMAEVYWDLEWTLQQSGFDFTYDKRLYDQLHGRDTSGARGHLSGSRSFQDRLARFLENHDEPRAAGVFPRGQHEAAAIATFFAPGLKFFHEGQFEGRTVKLPIQLRRRPHEAVNADLASFYAALLPLIRDEIVRDGEWSLAGVRAAWEENGSHAAFIAMHLRRGERHWLVAVNFADHWSQCFVESPVSVDEGWGRRAFEFRDLLRGTVYERETTDLLARGLYLDVEGWGFHVFEVTGV